MKILVKVTKKKVFFTHHSKVSNQRDTDANNSPL